MSDMIEIQRLAALDALEILDTPREPLFDGFTALAARTFNVPIALISLVDETRQWFKAGVGLDVDHTARNISFCQYAIRGDDVFIVRDALADPRFRDTPLAAGPPHIRFYAGAPLITPEGFRLGSLCVIDRMARPDFSDADAALLQSTAASVVQALILRFEALQRVKLAETEREHLKLLTQVEQMAKVGVWSWDVATDRTTWSAEVRVIHGFPMGGEPPGLDGVLACYHPQDAQVLQRLVERAIQEGKSYDLEARIIRPDGSERRVVAKGECRFGAGGTVAGLFGTFQDVTDLRLADEALRASEMRARLHFAYSTDLIEVAPEIRTGG